MPTLLQLDSSPRSASVSNKLAAQIVAGWKLKNPGATVYHHNTSNENLPVLNEALLSAFHTPAEALSEEQKPLLALPDQLARELIEADLLVIGAPMWNLSIPASLKVWIDLIVRNGVTFQYTAGGGVESLLPKNKKAIVVSSRGGAYPAGTPAQAWDQLEPYLRTALGFLGIFDLTFIYVDNQNRSGGAAEEGLKKAEEQVAALAL